MKFTTFSTAVVLAFASSAQASSAIVKNECSFPVYLWSVGEASSEMYTIESKGEPYSEEYVPRADAGMSLKISTVPGDLSTITQFEYTLDSPNVWYDASNINGYPFQKWGLQIIPSSSSCPNVTCEFPGVCTEAYNAPSDNAATHMCDANSDLTMTLCPPSTSSKREAAPEAEAEPISPAHAHAHARRQMHSHQRRAPRGQLGMRK
ncbi:hypothetical protein MMC13_002503 [Lambiella insularis]|nr:hypothetical protein [Lambiella insularis]